MSVIVAGVCKVCKKEYWVSFGRPAWYKEWVSSGGVKWKEPMEEYRVLREKRLCEECGKMAWGRFMKMVVSLAKEEGQA